MKTLESNQNQEVEGVQTCRKRDPKCPCMNSVQIPFGSLGDAEVPTKKSQVNS